MIDALIAGKLYGQPKAKTAKNGNQFATAKVRAAAGDGESLLVSVIAFSQTAVAALLALEDGDSVALAGELTPRVWTDREGNAKPAADLVAQVVTTAYHVGRKRKAVQPELKPPEPKPAHQGGGDPWEEPF
jgi:single-stranded DNA-binding protein